MQKSMVMFTFSVIDRKYPFLGQIWSQKSKLFVESEIWCKENLVKHQKVSKYYENDSLQHFLLHFMSFLDAPVVENSHI